MGLMLVLLTTQICYEARTTRSIERALQIIKIEVLFMIIIVTEEGALVEVNC